MANGTDYLTEELDQLNIKPRIGIQKTLPGNHSVTVFWDLAIDQSWPTIYNLYYSEGTDLDFSKANVIPNIQSSIPEEYFNRTFSNLDNQKYPYQYTVKDLKNGIPYTFAIRAEDRNTSHTYSNGRKGPNGGIEDLNTITLTETPYRPHPYHNALDGNSADWPNHIQSLGNEAGDYPEPNADIKSIHSLIKNNLLYLKMEFAAERNNTPYTILFDTDENPDTGFKGADYMISNHYLYEFTGDSSNSWYWSTIYNLYWVAD
jgi:hypothetical protein